MTTNQDDQPRRLVLLSGGIDSALLLWRERRPTALFVNYGQPSALYENRAAKALCERKGCEFLVSVVSLELGDMSAPRGSVGPRVVPGRNLVLLGIAANHAARRGIEEVLIGAHAGDRADYMDCRAEFMFRADKATEYGAGVRVKAPLMKRSKRDVVAEAASLGVPLEQCWSCYTPTVDGQPCGSCNSCVAVRR